VNSLSGLIDAINIINLNTTNKNIRPGAIIGANTDGTYTVLATTDKGEEIKLYNRKSDSDSIAYTVQDILQTAENINIQILLKCPDGDINRAVIDRLAQYNFPATPTVHHFTTGSSGGCCFLPGTLIKTVFREIEIEKIRPGLKIFGYDEKFNKIVQCRVRKLLIHNKEEEKVTEYYLLKTENSKVKVTRNHPFYTKIGEYRQIEQINDYIYLHKNNEIIKEKILSKKLICCEKTTTYNLSLDLASPCNYFANNYLVHNVYCK